MVLVATNVCRMGVDLHNYCWDVVHYSPSWTPNDFEQKSGRIDRPRNNSLRQLLPLGKAHKSSSIRIHHVVLPFGYDERILRRMNLRSHLSERLLASRHQEKASDEVARRFRDLAPLDLSPGKQ